APTKFTVAPVAGRLRLALVSFAVTPEAGAAAKPVWIVEAPAFNVIVPTTSLDAVLAVLLATKVNVPPPSATPAVSLTRLALFVPELSRTGVLGPASVTAVTPPVVVTSDVIVPPTRPDALNVMVGTLVPPRPFWKVIVGLAAPETRVLPAPMFGSASSAAW